jgi:hypothetical protein
MLARDRITSRTASRVDPKSGSGLRPKRCSCRDRLSLEPVSKVMGAPNVRTRSSRLYRYAHPLGRLPLHVVRARRLEHVLYVYGYVEGTMNQRMEGVRATSKACPLTGLVWVVARSS